jgi:ADP-ribosyl-[dinitrogen reductase] hydrolase
MNNDELLDQLFANHYIRLCKGKIFNQAPVSLPDSFSFDKVRGMLLGLAIGDSRGNTSESISPRARHNRYDEIRSYLPNRYSNYESVGLPSDDTQLAFWTLEQFLRDGRFIPENLADIFCQRQIFGIGSTFRHFIKKYKDEKIRPWYHCGIKSAGNGALMRIAPMLIPHLATGTPDLWADVTLSAILTHNDSASTSACLAYVKILWELLAMEQSPEPAWWAYQFIETARDLEISDNYKTRGGLYKNFQGTLCNFVENHVFETYGRGLSVLEACDRWYSGAYILETIPCVLYILMKHAHEPIEAIVRAVNDTRDNDTIAAIVGASLGALYGYSWFPEEWTANFLGRTSDSDDGKIHELIDRAEIHYHKNIFTLSSSDNHMC